MYGYELLCRQRYALVGKRTTLNKGARISVPVGDSWVISRVRLQILA